MCFVENPEERLTTALLAVERSVDKQGLTTGLFHTLHALHIAHNLSTSSIHQKWILFKKLDQDIRFLISSSTELKDPSDSIISSIRLQALIAVVWSFRSNSVLMRL